MEKKSKIIIAVIVVVIVIILGIFAYTTFFNKEVTSFDNNFMSGEFTGANVVLNNTISNDSFSQVYEDKTNNIQYSLQTADAFNFTVGQYLLKGATCPEKRDLNGVDWSIYYAPAQNNVTKASMHIYFCTATVNNQSYLVMIVAQDSTKIKCDGTTYCDLYKYYVEPLLSSTQLKQTDKVPTEYSMLGISKSQYDAYLKQIDSFLVKHGNV
ncbi:MAG: hypothetical protein MJ209_00605 [archaeon]|nr:hypothetical protein [archaeon]